MADVISFMMLRSITYNVSRAIIWPSPFQISRINGVDNLPCKDNVANDINSTALF